MPVGYENQLGFGFCSPVLEAGEHYVFQTGFNTRLYLKDTHFLSEISALLLKIIITKYNCLQ
jgi:hypothetical protein